MLHTEQTAPHTNPNPDSNPDSDLNPDSSFFWGGFGFGFRLQKESGFRFEKNRVDSDLNPDSGSKQLDSELVSSGMNPLQVT